MFEKVKEHRIIVGTIVFVMLMIAIPVTINFLARQQEIRSRASGEAIVVKLTPQSSTILDNKSLDIAVTIDGKQNDISAVDITFSYDPILLEFEGDGLDDGRISNSSPISSFSAVLNSATNGSVRYVGVNPSNVAISGSEIYIGTLHFKTRNTGTATVGFSNIHVNASGVSGALPIDTDNTKPGTYTITDTATTVTSTPTTPTPIEGVFCGQAQTWGRNTTTGACTLFSTTCLDPGFVNDPTCPGPTPTTILTSTQAPTTTPTPSPFGGTSTPTQIPTATIFPTATIAPNQTTIALTMKMTGIGADPQIENNVVLSPQRAIQVLVINAQNNLASSTNGIATFNPQTGLFRGVVSLGENFPSGTYLIKLRTDNTLWRQVPGIQNITIGILNETQIATLISGDLNADNEINLLDYNAMLTCLLSSECKTGSTMLPGGSPTPTPIFQNRERYDFNNDGLIDELDLNILYSGFTKRQGD